MSKLNPLPHLLLTSFDLWLDALRIISLSLRPNWALVAENLFAQAISAVPGAQDEA